MDSVYIRKLRNVRTEMFLTYVKISRIPTNLAFYYLDINYSYTVSDANCHNITRIAWDSLTYCAGKGFVCLTEEL